ncbi:hypothetical protein FQN54_008959 [Arachnomyces sp. PD_36]|nr:hypothetical protein FQN54_008959 [Arachnomyces sp. PD_36]
MIFREPLFDEETDVLIIGSGGAGLTAALRSHYHGLRSLVVEKDEKIGGSSAYSGGGLWIPNNPVSRLAGVEDTKKAAMAYMEAVIGNVGPVSSRARKEAFLENGPKMVSFLQDSGYKWRFSRACPDYYPKEPGSKSGGGRTIEPDVFDVKKLGDWSDSIRQRPGLQLPPLFTYEAIPLTRMGASLGDFLTALKVMMRGFFLTCRGQAPATMGKSLVGQLLFLNRQADASIWRSTSLIELISDQEGSVIGARVEHEGKDKNIRAKRGVLLAAGGFAHNRQMREEWGPAPASIEWTNTPLGDTGDAITAGMKVGAATTLMDEAWWGPSVLDPTNGTYVYALQERSKPFSIVVDSTASRFMNESEPYNDAGHHQYTRNQEVKAIPAWLIFDWNHRKRYAAGSLLPRQQPKKEALDQCHMYKADTIDDLAKQTGLDSTELQNTIRKFNTMAEKGVDEDFHRGETTFDNYFGDPKVGPNPNLGPIAKPPFYAMHLAPGDLGTKGGLLTDEHARVLKNDGTPIKGLYAAGNTSASVMGTTYVGAGSTLGPALTFAYIAANHMAASQKSSGYSTLHLYSPL